MTVVLDGSSLSIEDVVEVARKHKDVDVSEESWNRINQCRDMIQVKIDSHEIMYGVTTGIGEFSEVVLDAEQLEDFQKFLIYSHAAGIGGPLAEEVVRAAMCGRINVHCNGNSGGRSEITEKLIECLNAGVTPVCAEIGSVGACGDLSPMSQMAMTLMGEGEAFYEGKRMPSLEALKICNIEPLVLQARDGLALINGSNMLTGMAALTLYDANLWIKTHDIAAATSIEP